MKVCQALHCMEGNYSFILIKFFSASYTLSRLPSEVGVYLALTGRKLNANELHELQLVYGQLEDLSQAKAAIHKSHH
jgi:enoyl-CoA hydratase/carnithine racemase